MSFIKEELTKYGKMDNKVKRFEKALYALLDLSYETDNDLFADIITDTLGGFELMEQYENNAVKGEKDFKEHFYLSEE